MNVSYDRRAIEAIDDLLRQGRWESWLHARLRERGFELWVDADAVIDHVKDFGFREFASQRYHYSRAYAACGTPSSARSAVYALGSPLLVPLLVRADRAQRAATRRRHRRESTRDAR